MNDTHKTVSLDPLLPPTQHHRLAAPMAGPAQEMIDSGFALENADAPILHAGLNLADLAHVQDLYARGVIPQAAAADLTRVLLKAVDTAPEDFPYDPMFGEPYNCRERYFIQQIGDTAGWLHVGRPRREAVRISLRLHLRDLINDLIEASAELVVSIARLAARHSNTLMPDQTYLQHAQPSTFGHYVLSFAYPTLRDIERCIEAFGWTNASPGGAGCVNGSRIETDRDHIASLLGFDSVIEHTRDAMWQIDGLISMLASASSLVTTQSKLAEDLEIWASNEFDFVTIGDGYSRASVLMPQKRNPYALSIVRGASGILIGRLSGFLAVSKSPSARSDNLIYAYGEVPRALDLAIRTTRLSNGVMATLEVNAARMRAALDSGFSQSTDLAEYVMEVCGVDYRTAYLVVGIAVRQASQEGLRGIDLDGERLDRAAVEFRGKTLGLTGRDLTEVLDPTHIVATRTVTGGAAPGLVEKMAEDCERKANSLMAGVRSRRESIQSAEKTLLAAAAALIEGES